MASFHDRRAPRYDRRAPRRAARLEFLVWLLVLIASVAALAYWAGTASASPPATLPCERIYPAPPLLGRDLLGRPYYAQPISYEYVRCIQARGGPR